MNHALKGDFTDDVTLAGIGAGLKAVWRNRDEAAKLLEETLEAGQKKLDDLVDEAIKGSNTLTTIEAEEYAFNAIKGSDNADAIVLGKYESGSALSYDAVAKEMDAQYFNLDNWDELSSKYAKEEIWKINERFLDIQTSSGREIYLSHDPAEYMYEVSFYAKEIQYLIDNGYRFVKEGGIWHAIR